VTPKERSDQSFYGLIVPQLVTAGILLVSIAVGFWHGSGARTITNASWALFDIFMLAGIIRGAAPQRAVDEVTTLEAGADSDPFSRMTA
jgi:hypothetical protein